MKTLFRVTIAVILTLTLATCATAQAGNAMNSGSARVSGNTVTLTGGINAQRDITVPAGVTLDLTALPDNDESLVNVNTGGELVLVSGAITGNNNTDDDWANGGGVIVSRGIFTMSGGMYTKGGVAQTGGSPIVKPSLSTNDTLIAIPAR